MEMFSSVTMNNRYAYGWLSRRMVIRLKATALRPTRHILFLLCVQRRYSTLFKEARIYGILWCPIGS